MPHACIEMRVASSESAHIYLVIVRIKFEDVFSINIINSAPPDPDPLAGNGHLSSVSVSGTIGTTVE